MGDKGVSHHKKEELWEGIGEGRIPNSLRQHAKDMRLSEQVFADHRLSARLTVKSLLTLKTEDCQQHLTLKTALKAQTFCLASFWPPSHAIEGTHLLNICSEDETE